MPGIEATSHSLCVFFFLPHLRNLSVPKHVHLWNSYSIVTVNHADYYKSLAHSNYSINTQPHQNDFPALNQSLCPISNAWMKRTERREGSIVFACSCLSPPLLAPLTRKMFSIHVPSGPSLELSGSCLTLGVPSSLFFSCSNLYLYYLDALFEEVKFKSGSKKETHFTTMSKREALYSALSSRKWYYKPSLIFEFIFQLDQKSRQRDVMDSSTS